MAKVEPSDLLESQFHRMLIDYMYSNWFGVEIRNGLVLGNRILFPVAVELDPMEGKLNDFTIGQWLSGVDFIMANENFDLFVWELKRQVAGRTDFLEWLCQAYRGAFYLDKMDKGILSRAFRDTVQILYGLQPHSTLLTRPKNTLFHVHRAFYELDRPLSLSEMDCRCRGIILSLNPGAHFPLQTRADAQLNIGQIHRTLKTMAPDSKKLGWIEPLPKSYQLPVYLLEFDMSLSSRLIAGKGNDSERLAESPVGVESARRPYKRRTRTAGIWTMGDFEQHVRESEWDPQIKRLMERVATLARHLESEGAIELVGGRGSRPSIALKRGRRNLLTLKAFPTVTLYYGFWRLSRETTGQLRAELYDLLGDSDKVYELEPNVAPLLQQHDPNLEQFQTWLRRVLAEFRRAEGSGT